MLQPHRSAWRGRGEDVEGGAERGGAVHEQRSGGGAGGRCRPVPAPAGPLRGPEQAVPAVRRPHDGRGAGRGGGHLGVRIPVQTPALELLRTGAAAQAACLAVAHR